VVVAVDIQALQQLKAQEAAVLGACWRLHTHFLQVRRIRLRLALAVLVVLVLQSMEQTELIPQSLPWLQH
jgi:hypothetical protein